MDGEAVETRDRRVRHSGRMIVLRAPNPIFFTALNGYVFRSKESIKTKAFFLIKSKRKPSFGFWILVTKFLFEQSVTSNHNEKKGLAK